ncbi:hypothetical protein [Pseudodesulfovibrio senegalensis]|jgi:hypothetical protein|uniref:Uncharacterized protein n=1 Tax=Pseudodesulfovibrio senegalensis TaxID=1721087 RepID=A0A6N6N7X2_9BACT|nr:hypothetical protein [Pseudodesulfovibrio senegalensis]KAB1443475.1 hypothetical protein F8A88_04290 [Pseudodesulfovibrio senegalensis]
MADVTQATGFKRVQVLFREGRIEEGTLLLKALQDEYIALCDENSTLKRQLTEVADVLDLAQNVAYDGQKYWLEDGNERKGPFCQLCYDREGLLIHLQPHGKHWECQSCKSLFMTTKKETHAERKRVSPQFPLVLGHELG